MIALASHGAAAAPTAIAIGCDPGMADGKPLAIVAVDTETMRITSVCEGHDLTGGLWYKLGVWRMSLLGMIQEQRPDVVGVEDARGPGGSGYQLQALVNVLMELAMSNGVVAYCIPQAQAKKTVGHGRLSAEQVAHRVRMMLSNAQDLPICRGFDYEAAVSIALAAEAKLREAKCGTEQEAEGATAR